MDRRKFLIGAGGTVIGASALIGSGAFSRVEADRYVSIQVATDENAYLGLQPMETPNSLNYVGTDEEGHLEVIIDEHDDFNPGDFAAPGEGVNSNSTTEFDGMFRICNQGKATANISIDVDGLSYHQSTEEGINENGDPVVDVRDEDGNSLLFDSSDEWEAPGFQELELEVGGCEVIQIVTQTYGVDATIDEPLVEGTGTIIANAPDAGQLPD